MTQMEAAFFDHNSTTPLDARVLAVMQPFLSGYHGNPTSRHRFGRTARHAIEEAREQVARSVNVKSSQVIFTASGTEADNHAIFGLTAQFSPAAIAVSSIEHPAVMRPAHMQISKGWKLLKIAVDHQGVIDLDNLDHLLAQDVALVSVMMANNETGTIQPIEEVVKLAKKYGSLVHTDAVQALGKLPIDFASIGANAMTLSSHKVYGPQGAAALILDKRADIAPFIYGGGQERGLRSGTENTAAIVGFGMACELANEALLSRQLHTRALRDQLEQGLSKLGARIFGQEAKRLSNTSFFAFEDIEGETLVMAMDRKGFAIASGSACSSDSIEPSSVLLAMGVDPDFARGAVRVSVGQDNSSEQIATFLTALESEVQRLKQLTAIAV